MGSRGQVLEFRVKVESVWVAGAAWRARMSRLGV